MKDKKITKRHRINILYGIFSMLIFGLIIRLYFLQVHPSEEVAVDMVNHQVENISDVKYRVLDTAGRDIINSNKEYVMVIDVKPFMLNNYEETLEDLMALNFIMKSEEFNFNYSDIMKNGGKTYYTVSEETYLKLNKLENIKGMYTYIYEKLDTNEAWKIENIFSNIVNDKPASGSLGDELNQYVGNNNIPIERFYLNEKAIYGDGVADIRNSNSVKLTINQEWQDGIREILKQDKYSFIKNVGVVVCEADTGKIRALVQKDETEPNINLGIQQLGYDPGSVFKAFTEAIGLELGLITTETTFVCSGNICSRDGKPYKHGALTIEDAMEVSCNDIIAIVGNKIGYEKMMDYCNKIGLFKRVLNIEGNNMNEAEGVKSNEKDGMSNVSIGQSISVTPIQISAMYNTIANDGIYVKPIIVEAVLDKDNNIVQEYKNEEVRVFSGTTAKITQDTLVKVISEGLGYEAKVTGVEVGGKTGTSTGEGRLDYGWFAGYFKYNNKNYTIVVLSPDLPEKTPDGENSGGGNTGAPIFGDVVRFITEK